MRDGLKNSGFTLIETLVAMAVLAFVTASIWSALFGIAKVRDRVALRDDFQQEVRIVLDRISNDLGQAFLIPQARPRTGFVADSAKIKFSSFSHEELDPESKECEQTLITYTLERDTENPSLSILKRRENKRLNEDFSEDESRPITLLKGITRFKLSFYDGEKFSDRWDNDSIETSQKDKIPRAVKAELNVKDENGSDHYYYTMVNIPLSRIEPSRFTPPSVSKEGGGGKSPDGSTPSGKKDGTKKAEGGGEETE